MRRALSFVFALTAAALPTAAQATYSIGATDTATGEVGGAGTSCVGTFSVSRIYGSSPGHGIVLAQARFNSDARDRAVELLAMGTPPAAVIAQITAPIFDRESDLRQYGVVDLEGRSAAFTGTGALAFAGDQQRSLGPLTWTVQGNILTSQRVLDQASAAFVSDGCDLADRLMLALEAGGENGEGDSRCTPRGIPSDGAFIEVDRSGEPAGNFLRLRVDNTSPENPLALLRAEYDRWRVDHPCPAPGEPDAGPTFDAGPTLDAGSGHAPEPSCGCSSTAPRSNALILFVLLIATRAFRLSKRANRASRER